MAEHNKVGKEGENEARLYLEKQGYTILHTNWRWHHYELDLIVDNGCEVVVVEVKTRSENYLVPPENAVNKSKIRRIVTAADAYLRFFSVARGVRFDVIFVVKGRSEYRIEHIEDAFYAPIR